MNLIIVGTNRAESRSAKVGNICQQLLKDQGKNTELLDLAKISNFGLSPDMYNPDEMSSEVIDIQEKLIKPSKKWILVIPEYNGGVPGIFKLFLDAISVRDKDANFKGKEVLLIGVAAGRAGNARGIDYMTNCLNYLGMKVYPSKFPISSIHQVLKEDKLDEGTTGALKSLLQEFI